MSLIVTLEQSHPQGPRHAQVGMIAVSAVVAEGGDTPEEPEGGVTLNLESILAPLGVKPIDILDVRPQQPKNGQLPVVTPTETRGKYTVKNMASGDEGSLFWVFYHPNSPMTNV
jgi:hypothetical protein